MWVNDLLSLARNMVSCIHGYTWLPHYLVEVSQSFVEVSQHSSGRLISDLN